MIDSRLPRFSQAVQAVVLAVAFLLDIRLAVVVLAAILVAAALGGPGWNVFGRVFSALRIPPGEMEPAGPPRFAQQVGAVFLTVGSIGLFVAERDTTAWWVLGWGPALMVAVLSGLAATTSL